MIPVLVSLACGALLFYALVETAFGLLMRLPKRLEAEQQSESDALSAYLDDPLTFFVPSRIMRGLLLVIIVALLAQLMEPGFTGALILLGSGFGILIGIGQVLPALIVRRSPERYLELLLPAFTLVANVLSPLTVVIVGWLGAPTPAPTRAGDSSANLPQIQAANGQQEAATTAPADQNRLLRSVVDFGQTLVREVMTPRPDIVAIQADATIDDLRRLVQEQEYSRLPVYAENLDNIVGLIVVKDLIQMTDAPAGHRKVSEMMRPAAFVPETKRVVDLLKEFQRARFQLAMVVDEYGGTAGLVTVEDVVEELVGEIRDEYDLEAEPVIAESDDTFVFSGKIGISELSDRLGIEIEEGEFETVGGFVLARVGRVPAVGEKFEIDGFEVEIMEAERRRIHKVRFQRIHAAAAETPQ